MNIIKKYLTLKRIAIFFGGIFIALFIAADFSTALMDWQFYKAESINDKCSGIYIYDKELYKEAQKYGDKIATLSNGFPIEMESLIMDTQYSRIGIIGRTIFFIDNNGDKHIVYQIRKYVKNILLFISVAMRERDLGLILGVFIGFQWETMFFI